MSAGSEFGRFTHRNEGFVCENCGHEVPAAHRTCRNHCPACLCSKHVDVFPGDRANNCQGIMDAVGYELDGKKGLILKFRCRRCGEIRRNVACRDGDFQDDYEKILKLSNQSLV